MKHLALTIAGSDPSGGAGLQADLKTFHQHGVYGMSVVTLLTVQSTQGVARVEPVSASLVTAQLEHLLADLTPGAAKTGALGNADVVEAVATCAGRFTFPLVVDPVMVSKHGAPLMTDHARRALVSALFPLTTLVTPNAHEAALLAGFSVATVADARRAARAIAALGPKAVLVKGGHLEGDATDVLFHQGEVTDIAAPRLDTRHTHGTGCTLSAAITAWLARGTPVGEAIARSKRWLSEALRTAEPIGHGIGPVNHFAPVDEAQAPTASVSSR